MSRVVGERDEPPGMDPSRERDLLGRTPCPPRESPASTALTRRAEAAEATVRTLETHVAEPAAAAGDAEQEAADRRLSTPNALASDERSSAR